MDTYLWLGTGDGYMNIYQIKQTDRKLIKPITKSSSKSKLNSTSSFHSQDLNLTKKHVAFSQSSLNLFSNKPSFKQPSPLSNELRVFNFKKSLEMNNNEKLSSLNKSSSFRQLNEQSKVDSRLMIRNYLLSLQTHTALSKSKSSMPELNSNKKETTPTTPNAETPETPTSPVFSYSVQVSENLRPKKRLESETTNYSTTSMIKSKKNYEFDDVNNDYISDNLWSGSSRLSYSNKDISSTSSTSSFKEFTDDLNTNKRFRTKMVRERKNSMLKKATSDSETVVSDSEFENYVDTRFENNLISNNKFTFEFPRKKSKQGKFLNS